MPKEAHERNDGMTLTGDPDLEAMVHARLEMPACHDVEVRESLAYQTVDMSWAC